ncbi:MAG: dihydromonapterin reductase [Thiomicrospira sp.]|uniref:dihydromonapterin reductase n=1 Tax=Thiomicrospira sp. TaxID=935 RepID=UPI0019F92F97|nr:dihydromonapterin reductase [Thiomicrospira sp.]MBE0493182.1 dihydromonapterin reductase [Thiomicrospira sp.]
MKLKNAILITGAGQRVGLHLAKQFLLEKDYPVIFSFRNPKPGVDELIKLGAHAIQVDFTDAKQRAGFIEQVGQTAESLRAIVHNASIWLDDEVENSFDQQWQVHVKTPYELNRALTPLLRASDGELKDIISLSDASVERGSANQIGYSASKAALQNMTRSFAQALAPDIKVNDIAPGLVMFNQHDKADYREKRLQKSLLGIEPGAQVVFEALTYLMNSPYSTGSTLTLDGGQR